MDIISLDRKKNLILTMAIAGFLAADITIGAFWYLYQDDDDDPNSPTYVPSDWKHLVLANLGLTSPPLVPVQYIGKWIDDAGGQVVFQSRGQFSNIETDPHNAEEVLVQANGRVFAADPEYITVKVTSVQKLRLNSPPTRSSDGFWTMQLDGKTYKKTSQGESL